MLFWSLVLIYLLLVSNCPLLFLLPLNNTLIFSSIFCDQKYYKILMHQGCSLICAVFLFLSCAYDLSSAKYLCLAPLTRNAQIKIIPVDDENPAPSTHLLLSVLRSSSPLSLVKHRNHSSSNNGDTVSLVSDFILSFSSFWYILTCCENYGFENWIQMMTPVERII